MTTKGLQPRMTRRALLASATAAGAGAVATSASAKPREAQLQTDAVWIDGQAPANHEGVTWGAPWPRGLHLSLIHI